MRTREILRQAKKDGRDAGHAAASWTYDGNTGYEFYPRILKGIEDGDPAILDAFNVPNLSGEYSGDPTPQSLAEDYGITEERDEDGSLLDEVCDVWMDAASEAFWHELERVCRDYVKHMAKGN